jgi:hypothetical protein
MADINNVLLVVVTSSPCLEVENVLSTVEMVISITQPTMFVLAVDLDAPLAPRVPLIVQVVTDHQRLLTTSIMIVMKPVQGKSQSVLWID